MTLQPSGNERELVWLGGSRLPVVQIALGILAVLITIFWLMPMKGTIRQMNRVIREHRKQLEEIERQSNLMKQLKGDYERLKRIVGSPVKEFERGRILSQLVSEISGLALQCDLHISAFQPGEPIFDREGRWIAMPIEVTAGGMMEALVRFLAGLRRLTPMTIVERIVLNSSRDNPDRLHIQLRIARYVLISSGVKVTSQRMGIGTPR